MERFLLLSERGEEPWKMNRISAHKDFPKAYATITDTSKYFIDMAHVEYMDSSALGMMLMRRERVGGESAPLTIVNCTSGIRKTFAAAGFDQLFRVD